MRCPYCGGFNADRAVYCTSCGRDLKAPVRPAAGQQSPYQQPRPGSGQQARPASGQQGRPGAAPVQQAPQQSRRPAPVPPPPPPPPAPEPPAPFPPRTIAELQALEQGALPYRVVESNIGDGHKKTVRIVYAKGVAWQQVATLLKACKEQQEAQLETVLVQGVLEGDTSVYNFTNGQLRFDRNVRLGGLTTNRYQIETGNGFETDSIRIVLNGS
ncbi:MAG: hypothetical protein ACRDIV_15175 [Ktedonobacteraceae bacterium]